MQKTAFIWDLDGTLLDSYEAILSGIEETFAQFSIPYDKVTKETYISYAGTNMDADGHKDIIVETINDTNANSNVAGNACPTIFEIGLPFTLL